MAVTFEELAAQIMWLPAEERAHLVDLLAESLDASELGPIDHAWLAQARHRNNEVKSGRVKPIPGDEALRSVWVAIGN